MRPGTFDLPEAKSSRIPLLIEQSSKYTLSAGDTSCRDFTLYKNTRTPRLGRQAILLLCLSDFHSTRRHNVCSWEDITRIDSRGLPPSSVPCASIYFWIFPKLYSNFFCWGIICETLCTEYYNVVNYGCIVNSELALSDLIIALGWDKRRKSQSFASCGSWPRRCRPSSLYMNGGGGLAVLIKEAERWPRRGPIHFLTRSSDP